MMLFQVTEQAPNQRETEFQIDQNQEIQILPLQVKYHLD